MARRYPKAAWNPRRQLVEGSHAARTDEAAGDVSARAIRVLTHVPPEALASVNPPDAAVEWIHVPLDGPVPAGAHAEVLFTFTSEVPSLRETLERGVRWVHTVGTGVDQFPLDADGDRALTCARGASSVPIAEWVMAMVLAHAKRLPESWLDAPPARWNLAELDGLAGRGLGLVGIGTIGQEVARRALAFEMEVRALRRTRAPSPVAGVAIASSLEELMGWADHLVVAASATDTTRHLLGREAFAAAKPGLHLVNVARGSLVDQDALREALDDGRVARASLDTVVPEPVPPGHWLYAHPKVQLSAHISWAAPGSFQALVNSFAANLERWIRGEPLANVVDLEAGY